jgi:hypothetical protein
MIILYQETVIMKSAVAALLLFTFAVPALGSAHKDSDPVPCTELWAAVKDAIRNSGIT